MFSSNIILLMLSAGVITSSVKGDFPDDPQPCKFKDMKCIGERIQYFLTTKFAGDKSINLPAIDPMKVPLILVNKGSDSSVNIDLQLKNNIVTGFKEAKLVKISGFGSDMTEKHHLVFNIKHLKLKGDYTIKGKVIILPIVGTGVQEVNADNVTIAFRFNGVPQEKNGATFMAIKHLSSSIQAQHTTYNFDNLFNGDKDLSDNINLFINENASVIWDEISGSLAEGLVPVLQQLCNDVFATYPYKDFFAKE